jgi:hypothetical protein
LASDTELHFEGPYIAHCSVAGNSLGEDGYTGEEKHSSVGLWRAFDKDHCHDLQLMVVRCTTAEAVLERKSTGTGLPQGHTAGFENKAGEEVGLAHHAHSLGKNESSQGIADMVGSLELEED